MKEKLEILKILTSSDEKPQLNLEWITEKIMGSDFLEKQRLLEKQKSRIRKINRLFNDRNKMD